MFTGLIQDVGELKGMGIFGRAGQIEIETALAPDISEGDSVAVNGVCLTAIGTTPFSFTTETMNTTLLVTALGQARPGERVNLELAMRASDRFGGHIVQGHVDGVGTVVSAEDDGIARRLRVELGPELLLYVVDKGSIALNGVSLTVAGLDKDWVEVSLIPETLERTTLGEVTPGRKINVECDVVAKYVERLLAPLAGKERT
jgi:riboflavin synthase